MKVLKIAIDKQRKYYRWEKDREFFRPGEILTGHVEFDPPGKKPPSKTQIVWVDSYGRLVRSTPGKWDGRRGRLNFELKPAGQVALANYLEVQLGNRREGRERFIVTHPLAKWKEYVVFVWAKYPHAYYNELRRMGIEGIIAYKQDPAENVLDNDFLCYVDQVSPEEVSIYHRPYTQYWEKPKKLTNPRRDSKRWFLQHWDVVRQRYKRARARLKGKSVALDQEGRKTLWRVNCPSDPAVRAKMRERIINTIVQHKSIRPTFYNLCDEPGTADQAAPFDFCYCPHCQVKFHSWLEKRYGSLHSLNKEWNTRFKLWRDVIPHTVDDTLRLQKKAHDFNFSSWADHRAFMDDVMNDTYAKMREFGREGEPNSIFGNTGGQGPNAYGGWDFAKLAKSVDLHVPYNISQNDDMLRSFQPKILKMAPYFGDDIRLVRRMWWQLFHGDCGQIHWDNNEPRGSFLSQPHRKWSKKAKLLVPTIRELTRGIGKQIMQMAPVTEKIAVYHSQATLRAHWMLGTLPQGEKWIDRGSGDCEAFDYDVSYQVRDSLVKLICDSGFQYRFVDSGTIETGQLVQDGFKVLILPHALAMSAEECSQIRLFVEGGGLLIADALPGVMNAQCRLLPSGQLDKLFGVRRKRFDYRKSGKGLKVKDHQDRLRLKEKNLVLKGCEPTLRTAGDAIPLANAGEADCLVLREVGRGHTLYLNTDFRYYYLWRYKKRAQGQQHAQALLAACLNLAGLKREVHLLSTGKPFTQLPGIVLRRFAQGPIELVCAVVNETRETSGVGEERQLKLNAFDNPSGMTVQIPRDAHLYDSRTGKYHGWGNEFQDHFDPMGAHVYALLPYRVLRLAALAVNPLKVGTSADLEILLDVDKGPAGKHIVRCDVYNGKGEWMSYYSKNVSTTNGRGKLHLPLAESDLPGRWRFELRDAVTGKKKTVPLSVGK